MENTVIFNGVFGSHLYGTDTPESDRDYKAIFLPNARDIILGKAPKHYSQNTNGSNTKNTSDDVDREFYSLQYFLELAKGGETIAIDMLHTPKDLNIADPSPIWDYIQENRHMFYTTNMKAYLGYVRKQAGKYGVKGTRLAALRQVKDCAEKIPSFKRATEDQHCETWLVNKIRDVITELPILSGYTSIVTDDKGNTFYEVLGRKYQDTMQIQEFNKKISSIWDEYGDRARKAEANEGIDWKAMHHACRGGVQLLEIYRTGDLQYPLFDAPFLLSVKQGLEPFKIVQEYLEDIVDNVEKAASVAAKNGMPAKVNADFWENFVYNVYSGIISKGK